MPITVNLKDLTVELRRAFEPLTGREVARSASAAINKTLSSNRVFMGKEIRRIYNMNTFDAKNEITQRNAKPSTMTGSLWGNAGFTPFEYFKLSGEGNNTGEQVKVKRAARYKMQNGKRVVSGRQTQVEGSGRHATFEVSIVRGRTKLFTHAFIAQTKNGPMLFNRGKYNYRTNVFGSISQRNPISRMRTLSVWQEMTNRTVLGRSASYMQEQYRKELLRLMELQLRGKWR